MRPWQGALVSVVELHATRKLCLLDCGNAGLTRARSNREEEFERFVWTSIGEAFSRPVDPTSINVEYIPTQILAEAVRNQGFDGIQYRSHLGEGMNVVVFELSDLSMGERQLWAATRVSYELSVMAAKSNNLNFTSG